MSCRPDFDSGGSRQSYLTSSFSFDSNALCTFWSARRYTDSRHDKKQVGKLFHQADRPALLTMPLEAFANFRESQRKINRDGHVEVAKAYYSTPPEYLGRTVSAPRQRNGIDDDPQNPLTQALRQLTEMHKECQASGWA